MLQSLEPKCSFPSSTTKGVFCVLLQMPVNFETSASGFDIRSHGSSLLFFVNLLLLCVYCFGNSFDPTVLSYIDQFFYFSNFFLGKHDIYFLFVSSVLFFLREGEYGMQLLISVIIFQYFVLIFFTIVSPSSLGDGILFTSSFF